MNISFLHFSSYEGWDNPFRPEGEISLEADELLRLWKQGKLDEKSRKASTQSNNNNNDKNSPQKQTNGQIKSENGNVDPSTQQNGGHKNGATPQGLSSSTFEVRRETVGLSQQPHNQLHHVTISDGKNADDEDPKKKKTDGCCSLM